MQIKRILATVLLCGVLSATVVPVSAADASRFVDIDKAWYTKSVIDAEKAGYLDIYPGTQLSPNKAVTVAEFTKTFFDSQGIGVVSPQKGESWKLPYLRYAGTLLNVSNRSDGMITREKATVLISKTLQLVPKENASVYFEDTSLPEAAALKEAGLINGIERNGKMYFDGTKPITRAELAAFIDKFIEYAEKNQTGQTKEGFTQIHQIPTGINPNVTLPDEPKTVNGFKQVLEYMMANNLTTVSIPYQETLTDELKTELYQALQAASSECKELMPEYFYYYWKTTIKYGNVQEHNFRYIIILNTDVDQKNGFELREDAFLDIAAVYKNMYQTGALNKTMTERERARYITQWVVDYLEYKNTGNKICHTGWGAIHNGYGVCTAYTSLLNTLLALDGIQHWGQVGYIKENNEYHMWTTALLDGEYVHIDTVMCDRKKTKKSPLPFFALPTSEIRDTHIIGKIRS